MPQVSLPIMSFSIMTVTQLLEAHNQLAKTRGRAPLKKWGDSHVKLAERVALLRTQKIIACAAEKKRPARRGTPIRDTILKLLSVVDHYEYLAPPYQKISVRTARKKHPGSVQSVGLSYPEILRRLRKAHPQSTTGCGVLRWTATQVRNGIAGFEKCNLPQKRPHGEKK